MRKIFCIVLCCIVLASCGVNTTYLGKSYPRSNNVEVFFDFRDISPKYEVMGYIDATPEPFGSIEKAQAKVEEIAKQKGADAVVFEGMERIFVNPTVTTTEDRKKNEQGGYTKTSTTVESATEVKTLKATFIKYK